MSILEGRALEECEGGDEEEQSRWAPAAGQVADEPCPQRSGPSHHRDVI